MFITTLQLYQFRCFSSLKLDFEKPIVIIEGCNGTGKTSLLEALYFMSYKRSFRTASPHDLINYTMGDAFHIKVAGKDTESPESAWNLAAGYSPTQKTLKLNDKSSSFQEISALYRTISLTEDDLLLIKGQPAVRRTFIDQTLCLMYSEYLKVLRHYKKILEARNKLLESIHVDYASYLVWSQQLWVSAQVIEKYRLQLLQSLENHLKQLLSLFLEIDFSLQYHATYLTTTHTTFEDFLQEHPLIYEKERRAQRSLCGPHLHDIQFVVQEKSARDFSSRGMQKLLVVLLKIAQIQLLNKRIIFLIDDFFLDLDTIRLTLLGKILSELGIQLFITAPFIPPIHIFSEHLTQRITITR
ncbi:MAG: DNA replication and repair protein RecF [Candidatus Babeliaceae bacterium]